MGIRQFRPLLGGLVRTRYSNIVYRELALSPVSCDQSGKGGNNRNNAPECPECKSPLTPVSSLKSVGPTFWECTICGIYCKKEIRETKQLSNEVESIQMAVKFRHAVTNTKRNQFIFESIC